MIKKYLFSFLFFTIIFIASCITFDTRKKLEKYTYDEEILVDNINLWDGGIKVYKNPKTSWYNHRRLLLLLDKDHLQYIVTNDLKKTSRYKYMVLKDSTQVLTLESNPILFDRFGPGNRDSIVVSKNIIIQKTGFFSTRPNSNETNTISTKIFVKEGTNVYVYALYNTSNSYIGQLSTQTILERFQQKNLIIKEGILFSISQTITLTPIEEEYFFRKRIMHFN